MKIFQPIFDLFRPQKPTQTEPIQQNNIDILISLNEDFEIDISLFIDKAFSNHKSAALFTSEFFHIINSGKLKSKIMGLLDEQIRSVENNNFINEVLLLDNVISESTSRYSNTKDTFIKPSSVFTKNSI